MVAPLVGAALISGASSLLGGLLGNSATKSAAKTAAATADKQIAATERNRDYQYSLNAPTIDRGNRAGELFSGFLGAGTPDYGEYVRANPDILAEWQNTVANSGAFQSMEDFGRYHYDKYGQGEGRAAGATDGGSSAALDAFRGSTGFQDLVKEGLGAVNANAYASGFGRSGATMKALQDRGMSLADRSSQTWLGNLNTVAQQGGQARGLVAGIGTSSTGMINDATGAAGDAQANASLVQGTNWANTLKNLGLAASSAYGSSYGGGTGGGGTAGGVASQPYSSLLPTFMNPRFG